MKKIKIGIPRALLFIEYLDFFVKFFEELGIEVIISNITNKCILNNGVKVTVDDACLPIKIFHGHVIDLIDKVDYIFVPRIMSINKNEHICPKFGGLPELIKYSIDNIPPIITTEINNYKLTDSIQSNIYNIGYYFTSDYKMITKAYKEAYKEYRKSRNNFKSGLIPINELNLIKHQNKSMQVLIAGHSYNLYDSYSNMNLFKKILKSKVNFFTPEMFEHKIINNYSKMYSGRQYWTFSKKIIGSIIYSIDKKLVDGIIYLTSFACGIDSVVIDIVGRIAKKKEIPILILSIDEHTGEAGINTRIEAFLDMLERRKNYESNVSTYGKHLYTDKSSFGRIGS